MKRTPTLDRLLATAAAASFLLTSCAGTNEQAGDKNSDKAGGEAAPITLSIGTDDAPGRPAADQIEEFVRQVDELSHGDLQVEPRWQAGGEGNADWDQVVARMVVDGELDLAMVPARAWDTEGVTTLRALDAPFLVTSDALVADIVTGDLAGDLLAGLTEVDVTGLALLPEGLRHLFVFGDVPASLTDLGGKVVRAPHSETTYALLEALGAQPADLASPQDAFVDGIHDGSVVAAESSFAFAVGLPAPATAIGNLVLYPKVNSLVANSGVFADLTEEQQSVLREAALATRDWAVRTTPGEAEAAEAYCARGLGVVMPDLDRPALDQAVQPVYDELETDPATKAIIAQIEALAPSGVGPAPLPDRCKSPREDPKPPRQNHEQDASVLDGTYRFEVTKDRLLERGFSKEDAEIEHGVNTVTMQDGSFTNAWRNPSVDKSCSGTYSVSGHRVTFRWAEGCLGDWSAAFSVEGDTIRWGAITALPPYNSQEDQNVVEAIYTVPWTRIE